MAYDVYVCHSSNDFEAANEICQYLENNNVTCFNAPRDIKGQNPAEAIKNGIENSEIFLMVMSESSQNSPYSTQELEKAFVLNKPIACYILDDVIPLDRTAFFTKNSTFINASVEDNYQTLLNVILEMLESTPAGDGQKTGVIKQSEDTYIQEDEQMIYVAGGSDDLIDFEIKRLSDDGYGMTSNINQASAVIAYVTHNSVNSSKIKDDIESAFKMNKPVIPIYLEDAKFNFGRLFKLKNRNQLKKAKQNALVKFALDDNDYCERYQDILKQNGIECNPEFNAEATIIEFESKTKDNFQYLKKLIDNSNEISLQSDIILEDKEKNLFEDGIEISRDNITLNGNGHTIDARSRGQIFKINADNITFKNITFINANKSAIGGHSSSLALKDCTFKGNSSSANAPVSLNGCEIEIADCKFSDNNSDGLGGALKADNSVVIVRNSSFIDNFARYGGAIRANRTKLTIVESKFDNNASQYGGAINFNECKIKIEQSSFCNNTAKDNGGAIETQNGILTINDCVFKNNRAKFGAAIRNHSQTFISDCEMCENTSKYGGAIFNQKGSVDLNNIKFIENESPNEIIYNKDLVKLNNPIFHSNCAINIINNVDSSNLAISGGELKDNDVEDYHIHNAGKSCSISRTHFSGKNFANNESELTLNEPKISYGEKIISNKGNILIKGSDSGIEKAIDNEGSIRYMVRDGDAYDFTYLDELIGTSKSICLEHDIRLESYEKDFFEGGIILESDGLVINGNGHAIDGAGKSRIFTIIGKNITLKNIIFKNGHTHLNNYENPLNSDGAAIKNNSKARLSIINCEFKDNASEDKGGVIDNRGGKIILCDSKFDSNHAKYTAGAIINGKSGKMKIKNSLFSKNSSNHEGGAIENKGEMTLIKSLLENNTSKYGGSIGNFDGAINMCSSIFKNNRAQNGGAIYNHAKGVIDIDDCIFEDNDAEIGGAIAHRGEGLALKSSKFNKNTAQDEGGAIWKFSKDDIDIIDCEFDQNHPHNIHDSLCD